MADGELVCYGMSGDYTTWQRNRRPLQSIHGREIGRELSGRLCGQPIAPFISLKNLKTSPCVGSFKG